MKTAAIYARYSTDNQTEQSIEGQIRVCQEFAEKNDLLIVETYIDRAMTGTNDNRTAFQKMMKDSALRQWSVVLVYKLDRFSRNKYESVIHKKTLKDNGVKILSAMENIPDSPEGTLMETLLEGFNQYYSEELAQKVNRGIRESWIKGLATGGRGYFGYTVVEKRYTINEYEAEIVRTIFTKYAQGYMANTIAQELQAQGVRRSNGELLTVKNVYKILHNSRYTGKVTHHGVVYDNIFPRIISDDLWEAVNAINEENKLAPSRKKEIYDYILSGKIYCGHCKKPMIGMSAINCKGNPYYYYICRCKRRKINPCPTQPIQKQQLEDLIIDATMGALKEDGAISMIADGMLEVHRKETEDNTALKLLLKTRETALKSSNNLIRAIEQGIITEQTKIRLTELERQIQELNFQIDQEKKKTYSFLTREEIVAFLKAQVFENPDDIKIRKAIVNMFIRGIVVNGNQIHISYHFQDDDFGNRMEIKDIDKMVEQSKKAALILPISSTIRNIRAPKQNAPNAGAFSFWKTK